MTSISIVIVHLMTYIISSEGILILSPTNTVAIFENRSITYACHHPFEEISIDRITWVINGVSISSTNTSYQRYISTDIEQQYSQLFLHQVTAEHNETEIQCNAILSTGEIERSETSTLLLQGCPPPVNNLQLFITDNYIGVFWNPPFIFPVLGKIQVSYIIEINSTTLLLSTETTSNTFYIYRATSQPIGCHDYKFHVMAQNPLGLGNISTISYIGKAPTQSSIELSSKSNHYSVILVTQSALLCRVSHLLVLNKDLNEVHYREDDHSFTSLHTVGNTYRYLLNFTLLRGFEYEMSMNIHGNNYNSVLNYNISTHAIRDVYVKAISGSQLKIQVFYFPHISDSVGAFITLLKCESISCDRINYNQSLYLIVRGTEESVLNVSYTSGNYLLYAYDTGTDGSVLPSSSNTSYPKLSRRLFLDHDEQIQSLIPGRNLNCIFKYSQKIGILNCNEQNISAVQQLLFHPIDPKSDVKLILGHVEPLNGTLCFSIPDEPYYVLSILLNYSYSQPVFGMQISPENADNLMDDSCPMDQYTTHMTIATSKTSDIAAIIGSVIAAVVAGAVLLLISIAALINLCLRRKLKVASLEDKPSHVSKNKYAKEISIEVKLEDSNETTKKCFPRSCAGTNLSLDIGQLYANTSKWMKATDELLCTLPDEKDRLYYMKIFAEFIERPSKNTYTTTV